MFTFANTSDLLTDRASSYEDHRGLAIFAWQGLKAFSTLALVTAIEYLLFHRVAVHSPSAIYLAGIIAITALCGTGYGIFCALGSVALCDFLFSGTPFAFHSTTNEILANAFIFVSAALLVGSYAELIRDRLGTAHLLVEASRAISGLHTRLPDQYRLTAPEQVPYRANFDWKTEWQNIAASILMVACACTVAWGLQKLFGVGNSLTFFVTAVLIVAIVRGARAGVFAAILAVVAFNLFSSGFQLNFSINTVGDIANLALFSAIAWWVGSYTDHVRRGRQMAQSLFEAGQMFSTMNNEVAVRRVLHKSLCQACNTSSVWVLDENDRSFDNSGGALPRQIAVRLSEGRSGLQINTPQPWRVRRLQIDGRSLGSVVLFWPAVSGREALAVDRILTVLVDLAAGAIARARLTAEQMDMQIVAQAEKLRTALLSSISHDFRTPLSGILGAATGLLELAGQHDKDRQRDLLLTIRNQAVRLNRYIENLLNMTRLENGALDVRPQLLLVEPLIYDAWEALGDYGGSLRILDVRIQQDAVIAADPFLFSQVMTNLFENAIKFTPEGSEVIVRGRTIGASQLIEIVDSGPGLAPDDLPHLFTRFYRAGRQKAPGLGLGLYIAKGLLDAMRGTVEARNREDGISGLVISITMPAGEGEL